MIVGATGGTGRHLVEQAPPFRRLLVSLLLREELAGKLWQESVSRW